jgi:hypothetical protein
MTNVLYPKFKEKIFDPGTLGSTSGTAVDLIDDTIKIALIDLGTYTYSTAHEYWSSASSALVGTAATLASKTITSGTFDAADVTFSSVTGNSIEALIIFKDTGTASTSPLIAFIDVKSGGGGISVTPNGGNIDVTFSASGIFSI